jgi:hypothetical protein
LGYIYLNHWKINSIHSHQKIHWTLSFQHLQNHFEMYISTTSISWHVNYI